jgi:hypothetical protein
MKNILAMALILTSFQALSQATGIAGIPAGNSGPGITTPGPVTNNIPTGTQPTPYDLQQGQRQQRQEENPGLTGGVNSGFNPGTNNLPSSATPVAPTTTLPSTIGTPAGTNGTTFGSPIGTGGNVP